jgi:hypothetical protein
MSCLDPPPLVSRPLQTATGITQEDVDLDVGKEGVLVSFPFLDDFGKHQPELISGFHGQASSA